VVTGSLAIFCDIHLSCLARHDLAWRARRWAGILRQALRQPETQPPGPQTSPPRFYALRIVLGISLVFILGPFLIFRGLGL
jgi:hypothetical protein